jgi:glutaredoxin 3
MKESITIYSKNDCIYCERAKRLLSEKNIAFREVLVDTSDECTVSELQDRTGMKTFPQIFIGNQVLGGFTQLQELEQKTGLKEFT